MRRQQLTKGKRVVAGTGVGLAGNKSNDVTVVMALTKEIFNVTSVSGTVFSTICCMIDSALGRTRESESRLDGDEFRNPSKAVRFLTDCKDGWRVVDELSC